MKQMLTELGAEASKASPPVAITAMTFNGHPVSDWVMVLTGVYVVLQAAFLIYKWSKYDGKNKDSD